MFYPLNYRALCNNYRYNFLFLFTINLNFTTFALFGRTYVYWDYSFFNVSVIRYADVLLLYAECLNDKGETTEAINIINKVRARVNVPALPLTMSKAEVLKHLQDKERPCELALEGSRWYDLVRWGIVEETLKAHNKPFVENYVDTKHQLFPIPHSEFLLNPDWEQNPNYSK